MLGSISTATLAAQPDIQSALVAGLWVMLAAVLAIAGAYLALAVRRRLRTEAPPQSFTLQNLRDLRDRGEISEREYTALRSVALDQAASAATQAAEAKKPAPPPAPADSTDPLDNGP